jgi:hypothetical protein
VTDQPTTEELVDLLVTRHREFYRRNPRGQLAQTCLMIREDGTSTAVECGWEDAAQRDLTLAVLRAMMMIQNAIRYAVWSEVWMVEGKTKPGEPVPKAAERDFRDYQVGDLGKNPNRIECIFTMVVEASGKEIHRLHRIIRGRSGGVRTLVEMEPMNGLGGALADLLPERTFN